MMLGIAVELFRQYGQAPSKPKRKHKQQYQAHPSRGV
jgi:hypothetical protein